MSGGHWEYVGYRLQDDLATISKDTDVASRWPLIRDAIAAVAEWIQPTEHEMDYDLSSDSQIPDDAAFDRTQFGALLDAMLKVAPDEWFPRGKWATIQAVQGRAKGESA